MTAITLEKPGVFLKALEPTDKDLGIGPRKDNARSARPHELQRRRETLEAPGAWKAG